MVGGSLAITVPAQASNTDVQPRILVTQFDSAAIAVAARGVSATTPGSVARKHVDQYLEQQARAGRLIDERTARVASLPDPYQAGKRIDIVWAGAKAPSSVSYFLEDRGKSVTTSMSVLLEPSLEAAEPDALADTTVGSGYDYASSAVGMVKRDGYCATTWFTAWYSSQDHHLESCFQSFQQPNTGNWIYNRWSTFAYAPAHWSESAFVTDFYVASRPWKGTNGNYITNLDGWKPGASSSTCTTVADGTLTIGSGTSIGITFPIHQCKDFIPASISSSKTIGLDLFVDGQGKRTATPVIQMDVAGYFRANTTRTDVWWADYNWVSVQWCSEALGFLCDPSENFVAKDSGW
jgi:hypothetical protein